MYQICIIWVHYFKLIILFILSVNMAKRSASAVWEYFTMFQDRFIIAKCNICSQEIRFLGASVKKFSIKSLWGHLKSKHKDEHSLAEKEPSKETEKKKKILKKQ